MWTSIVISLSTKTGAASRRSSSARLDASPRRYVPGSHRWGGHRGAAQVFFAKRDAEAKDLVERAAAEAGAELRYVAAAGADITKSRILLRVTL